MITENTRLTFGQNRGMPLKNCPDSYLQWMVTNLSNSDFAEWAVAAKQLLSSRKTSDSKVQSLEDQANELLRQAGYGKLADDKPSKKGYGRPIRRF